MERPVNRSLRQPPDGKDDTPTDGTLGSTARPRKDGLLSAGHGTKSSEDRQQFSEDGPRSSEEDRSQSSEDSPRSSEDSPRSSEDSPRSSADSPLSPEDTPHSSEDFRQPFAEGSPEPAGGRLTMESRKDLLQGLLQKRRQGGPPASVAALLVDTVEECICCRARSARGDVTAAMPEPDYFDSEGEHRQGGVSCHHQDGLILPRKLVNPCLASGERRQLHRELAFNQKIGKNVLGQKSELQRAMERHQELQQQRQTQLNTNKTGLERALEERLIRVEPKILAEPETKRDGTLEFLKVHAKLRSNIHSPS